MKFENYRNELVEELRKLRQEGSNDDAKNQEEEKLSTR